MAIDIKQIIQDLEKRGANKPCHRCGYDNFSVVDKYSFMPLQEEKPGQLTIGSAHIPVVLVVCNNCGAITAHALGALEQIPKFNEDKDADK